MSALEVPVPFHDGSIPCLVDAHDPTPYVALRPVCEELGLDYEAQHKKLLQQPWAVVGTKAPATAAVAGTGAGAGVAVIDRLTFAMWLATLNAVRLRRPGARAKVELYQREAPRALEQHFFGSPVGPGQPAVSGEPISLLAAELIGELIERQIACERRLSALESPGLPPTPPE
jgi:hypothetical protein